MESLSVRLLEAGALGLEERDASTMSRRESDEGVTLVAHFSSEEVAEEAINQLVPDFQASLCFVEGDDWRDGWKRFFKPVKVGRRLWICPSWEKADAQVDDLVLTIDPGRAFGSGTHETTRLVLRELDEVLVGDEEVLDVGTGSGILAIAAILLGARRATGLEVDEDALPVARTNALVNGVEHRLELRSTPIADVVQTFPLVIANIETRVLAPMASDLIRVVEPGGTLVLSGILRGEEESLLQAFLGGKHPAEQGLKETATETPVVSGAVTRAANCDENAVFARVVVSRLGEWSAIRFEGRAGV